MCHNGNLVNAHRAAPRARRAWLDLSERRATPKSSCTSTRSRCSETARTRSSTPYAPCKARSRSCSLQRDSLVGVRDPRGFRPLIIGKLGESSSSCAPRRARSTSSTRSTSAKSSRARWSSSTRTASTRCVRSPKLRPRTASSSTSTSHAPTAPCSGATSTSRGSRWAGSSRARRPVDADVVVPVPDSGVVAAIGYSQESGLPMEFGLIRNHYVGRTFIEPRQSIRHFGVKIKLNPVRSVIENRRVVLIDDSIVRGTTSRKDRRHDSKRRRRRSALPSVVSLRRPARVTTASTRRSEKSSSHRHHTVDEIAEFIGADTAWATYPRKGSSVRSGDDRDTLLRWRAFPA